VSNKIVFPDEGGTVLNVFFPHCKEIMTSRKKSVK